MSMPIKDAPTLSPPPSACHALPRQTTQPKPQGFPSPHFPSPSFRLFILLFTPAKLLGAHKFLSVLYGSLCGMSSCGVLLYSCSCTCSCFSSLVLLLLSNRDAFTNSCKLNLLRRAWAHLMTLLAKLATRYFSGQAWQAAATPTYSSLFLHPLASIRQQQLQLLGIGRCISLICWPADAAQWKMLRRAQSYATKFNMKSLSFATNRLHWIGRSSKRNESKRI